MVALSTVAPLTTVTPWWNVSLILVRAISESLNTNVPALLSKDIIAVLFVLRDMPRLSLLFCESTMIKSPPLSFSDSVPRPIVLPLRYMSRNLLVALPKSYASFESGIKEPVNAVLSKPNVYLFCALSKSRFMFASVRKLVISHLPESLLYASMEPSDSVAVTSTPARFPILKAPAVTRLIGVPTTTFFTMILSDITDVPSLLFRCRWRNFGLSFKDSLNDCVIITIGIGNFHIINISTTRFHRICLCVS